MILHTVPGSPNGRRVEAVISHLGLAVEIRQYDFFKGELRLPHYLALNGNAKAPTLQDGDFVLWETTAIMQYLCEQVGNTDLFPRSPRIRADITRWQCWEGLYFNAALGTMAFETVAKAKRDLGPADAALVEQARLTLDRFAPVLDSHLNGRQYMVDERLTLADYSMATFEPYINKVPYDFIPFRHIRGYFERMSQSEHWVRAGQAAVAQPKAA
jgi:glutathione S-transferase